MARDFEIVERAGVDRGGVRPRHVEALELVVGDALVLEHGLPLVHRSAQLGRRQPGLLAELAVRRVLVGLALAQAAACGEPERADVRPVRVAAAEQQQAVGAVEQQQPRGATLDDVCRRPTPPCRSGCPAPAAARASS